MTPDKSMSEFKRAWGRFDDVYRVHIAAMHAFALLRVLPDARAALASSIHVRHGLDPEIKRVSLAATADFLMDAVEDEAKGKFQTIRASALVSLCSAFEYLIKARFVDFAMTDPARAAGLLAAVRSPIKLDVAEVMGLPVIEQWFVIADELFRKAGDGGKPMLERVKSFLLDFTFVPGTEGDLRRGTFREMLDKLEVRNFNEAFLYRNCLVHNGARVDRKLATGTGLVVGEYITLKNDKVLGLTKAVRDVAEEFSPYWNL